MKDDKPISLYSIAGAVAWTLLVLSSLLWNLHLSRQSVLALAQNQAVANINKDLVFRRWVTSHGGVYVPIDDATPPNPFLKLPNRDIETTSGLKLTLMNPAYALRQMQEGFSVGAGVSAHITSLRPLNPHNAPDPWEKAALESFEHGVREVAAIDEVNGKPTMRVIRAMITEKGCLKCHPTYDEGDVRGGLTASVDLAPFLTNYQEDRDRLLVSHGGAWLAGLLVVVAFDRRARRLAAVRRQAEGHRRLISNVFEFSQEAIIITDAQANILEVNESFSGITGYSRDEVVGENPRLLSSGRHDRQFFDTMWSAIRQAGFWRGEIWNRRKNGDVYPGLLTISTVTGTDGQVRNFLGTFADTSQIKAQQDRLDLLTHFDPLTRLPNRVLMADRLAQAVAQSKRNGTVLAVGFLDLDNFKSVNESLGHSAGDQLLIEVSERLKKIIRGGDTVARLGGDEFVLVLCGLDALQECDRVINRVLASIAASFSMDGATAWISASIGVTLFPNDGSDPDTLLRHADHAMYMAKQAGGNRYHLFDPIEDRQAHAHHEAFARIQAALEDEELRLYFQPKINMRQGVVSGAEALIRWQHPERGLLPPSEFLPLVDDSDLAAPLGEWVIRTSLRQMTAWRSMGIDLPVSVNIAAKHLQRSDFADRIRQILAEYPQDLAQRLEFEVLETAALENISGVAQVIAECGKLGINFALDDFGTGYSSLSYLKRLPAKTLKIDQSFVRTMLIDVEDLAIVEGVVSLTQAFHREVIAEGVESGEHGLVLLQLGCDYGQGFGIARPMPGGDIPDWTRSWKPDPRWSEPHALMLRREDFTLLAMEMEHRNWVAGIAAFLRGGGAAEPPPPLDPRSCRFGRWYQTGGRERYGHMKSFAAMNSLHEQVHLLARELMDLAKAGNRADAVARLDELNGRRDAFLAGLDHLKRTIAAGYAAAPTLFS